MAPIEAYDGCLECLRGLDRDLLWFPNAQDAVLAAQGLVAQGDRSAGISTGDVSTPDTRDYLISQASAIADVTEEGQIIVSLSTHELTRMELANELRYESIGHREISGGTKGLLFLLVDSAQRPTDFVMRSSNRFA